VLRFSSIGITALVARILNAHDFGTFAVALTAFTLVSAIGEFGVTSCLSRADLDVDALAPTLWTVSLTSSWLIAALLYVFAEPFATLLGSSAGAGPIKVMSIIMALWGVSAVPTAQCIRDFKQSALFYANVLGFIPSTLVLLLLAKHGSGAMAFAWSRVAGQVVSCIVILGCTPKHHLPGMRRSALFILYQFGVPLALANLVTNILQNVDYALIGHFIGSVELGIYVIAFNSASWSTSLLGTVLGTVAMPAFSRVKHDVKQLRAAIGDGARAVMLISAPMCTLVVALARPLILTIYGSKWAAAAAVLTILSVYGIISILCQLFSSMLAALGKSRTMLIIQLAWLAFLAPAMVIGVKSDGIVGAAIAHVIIIGPIVLPCYLMALTRATGVGVKSVLKAVIPPFVVAVIAGVLAWLTAAQFHRPALSLIAGLIVGSLFYLLVTAPQLIALLGGGQASRPQVLRVLRAYNRIGRALGIPMGPLPRHAVKRGRARQRVPGPYATYEARS
jgi:lipopolysaccharide exporter